MSARMGCLEETDGLCTGLKDDLLPKRSWRETASKLSLSGKSAILLNWKGDGMVRRALSLWADFGGSELEEDFAGTGTDGCSRCFFL
jgi:hypothetical protein